MEQVDVSNYNRDYYQTVFRKLDYNQQLKNESFGQIYQTLGDLLPLSSEASVVDIGCGVGELCFYLSYKYGCYVTGIDYSKDAIDICFENLSEYKNQKYADKINFIHCNNDTVPNKNGITAVYLADVVEHLYDDELAQLFTRIKAWNPNGFKVLIHTDNNFYLNWIRPWIDVLEIFIFNKKIKVIKQRNRWERERHINLMNRFSLRKKMEKWGYREILIKYPAVSTEKLHAHIPFLKKHPKTTSFLSGIMRKTSFLLPSFYVIYEVKT